MTLVVLVNNSILNQGTLNFYDWIYLNVISVHCVLISQHSSTLKSDLLKAYVHTMFR